MEIVSTVGNSPSRLTTFKHKAWLGVIDPPREDEDCRNLIALWDREGASLNLDKKVAAKLWRKQSNETDHTQLRSV